MRENSMNQKNGMDDSADLMTNPEKEFSEVDLLRWIALQSSRPDQEADEYSDRITDAYGQKAGE